MTLMLLSILVLVVLLVDFAHWRWRGGRFTYFTEVAAMRPLGIALSVVGVAVGIAAVLLLLRLIAAELFGTMLLCFGIAHSSYSICCRELERRRGTVA